MAYWVISRTHSNIVTTKASHCSQFGCSIRRWSRCWPWCWNRTGTSRRVVEWAEVCWWSCTLSKRKWCLRATAYHCETHCESIYLPILATFNQSLISCSLKPYNRHTLSWEVKLRVIMWLRKLPGANGYQSQRHLLIRFRLLCKLPRHSIYIAQTLWGCQRYLLCISAVGTSLVNSYRRYTPEA